MLRSEHWKGVGEAAIASGRLDTMPLPWEFRGTVFRCAWEYPVVDFETEVGFHLQVLGFSTIALDEDYALFTTQDEDFTFACRRRPDSFRELSGHILCFMTKDIESFAQVLERRLPVGAIRRRKGSPVQTVLGLMSPAGLQIDIWEDHE